MTEIHIKTSGGIARFFEKRGKPWWESLCNTLSAYCRGTCCDDCLLIDDVNVTIEVVEPPRWRAEVGEQYYTISEHGLVASTEEDRGSFDYQRYKIGNYYRTLEEAEAAAERVKAAYLGD